MLDNEKENYKIIVKVKGEDYVWTKNFKNDRSILNLHRYLIDIIKNPESFNDTIDLSSLKSQVTLSKKLKIKTMTFYQLL